MDSLNLNKHISGQFNAELESIRTQVMTMGGMVEQQLSDAITAMHNQDSDLAKRVIEGDKNVNMMEVAIDEACVRIIAKRQPTASDLRLVMVISKTIAELERIGDVADKICRTALEKFSQQHQPLLVSLESLGRHTIQMLHDVLDAFARMDIDEAVRIYREDKKVDQEYEGIVRQLMTYMMEDSRTIPSVLTALFCARSIERIGDRCQNICEFIFYYVKGHVMDRFPRSDSIVQPRAGLQTYMAQVYGWMTVGLLLTAFVAWYAANSAAVMELLFTNRVFLIGLIIAQLALVIVLSAMIQKLSAGVTTMLFMLYSALTGLTLSSIFIVYTAASIASTFVVTAGMFGAMSLYGYTTKRDLSGFGNMLFMALIGIVLASLVNFWLKSEALMWAVTYIGVIVFVGLTAYDTQKLKNMGEQIDTRDTSNLRKYSILGALTLYLDFINLFLMLLRIFGNRR